MTSLAGLSAARPRTEKVVQKAFWNINYAVVWHSSKAFKEGAQRMLGLDPSNEPLREGGGHSFSFGLTENGMGIWEREQLVNLETFRKWFPGEVVIGV